MVHQSQAPRKARIILHIDMNAFYCSVHEAVEPHLYKGKPMAVAGSVELRKGIVVTCSYPARARGVRTGMQVREAMRLCPDLILLQPDFDLYRRFSLAFLEIVESYSPLVEATSIDECFVDITGSSQFGEPLEIAETIQKRIAAELGLPCSIGVAPNKLLAKMASDMKKPNGLTVLRIRDVPKVLWDKPCASLFGIGAKTAEKLKRLQIHTIGELATCPEADLTRMFGVLGVHLKQAANGIDLSPVTAEREQSKSVGHTVTLPKDVLSFEDADRVFLNLSDQVARRLRRQGLTASTVQITVRRPDMVTITRSFTLQAPTDDAADFYREACRLYRKHWMEGKPARLLGVTAQNIKAKSETPIQLDLFEYEKQPKREKLVETMDALRDKFGESAVLTAGMLGSDPSARIRDKKRRGTSLQMDHLRDRQPKEEQ
ncbi:DNA polymerase IV [Paenibacillus turpanensis]|uniref:DNA polymerase IV n=1 Tax=Paenibacillus turpanensis TaxID=2689078 RepID=UPI00140801A3|nr:DNA polymerase IV [Paenibacillus turpanensis]